MGGAGLRVPGAAGAQNRPDRARDRAQPTAIRLRARPRHVALVPVHRRGAVAGGPRSRVAASPGAVRVDGTDGAHELHDPGRVPGSHVLEIRPGTSGHAARGPNDGGRAVRGGRAGQSMVARAVPVWTVRVAVAFRDVCRMAAVATGGARTVGRWVGNGHRTTTDSRPACSPRAPRTPRSRPPRSAPSLSARAPPSRTRAASPAGRGRRTGGRPRARSTTTASGS